MMFDISREASQVASRFKHRTLSVEHVFLAAIEQLGRDYYGGGVFHFLELLTPVWPRLSMGVRETQETKWNASLPDVLGEHEREAMEGAGGGVRMIGLSGPPAGWPPPATNEYRELVIRFAKKFGGRRGARPTIYETLWEVISYPQVEPLLAEFGYSKESFQQRLEPYLDPKVAAQEIGPDVTRYGEVMWALGLRDPLPEEPTARFRTYMAGNMAMRTGSDTLTLVHLFLAGVEQALRGGRAGGAFFLEDSFLESFLSAGKQEITNLDDPLIESFRRASEQSLMIRGPHPDPYSGFDRATGEKVLYGRVPASYLKVPPEVENFLQKQRTIAARRQEQFTNLQVIASLLRYGVIKSLLKKLGYESQQIRTHVQRLPSPPGLGKGMGEG